MPPTSLLGAGPGNDSGTPGGQGSEGGTTGDATAGDGATGVGNSGAGGAEVEGSVQRPSGSGTNESGLTNENQSIFSIGLPTSLDLSPAWLLSNIGISSLLLLLLLAAAQLFNDALRAHHDELATQLADRSTVLGTLRHALRAIPTPPVLVSFGVLAVVFGLLADPNATFSTTTLAQMGGMLVAITVMVGAYEGVAATFIRRATGANGALRLFPLAIAVAALCLLLSRVLDVSPGVLYGLFTGVSFGIVLEDELEGRAYARASAALLAVALGAFFVHRWVVDSSTGGSAGFWVIVVDSAAAAVCVGGLQAVIVQLLPTRFVNGEKIVEWSRIGWFLLLAVSMALYMIIVIRPNPDQQSWGNTWFILGLVAFAVAFWAWASLHHRRLARREAEAGGGGEPGPDDKVGADH